MSLDSGYISEVAPTEFTNRLHVCGRSKWKRGAAIYLLPRWGRGAGLASHGNWDIGFEHSKFEKPGRDTE